MKMRFVFPFLLLVVAFVSVCAEARVRAEDIPKMIQEASAVLLDRSSSGEQIQSALIRLLDAAVLTLPQSGRVAEARSNLEAAKAELKGRSLFSEKGYQHLDLAYRALNAGKNFQFPEIHTIEEARTHIQALIAASIAGLKKGPEGPTSRLLLECIIMVVTPFPK
jgi:hypothetical protein